MVVMGEVVTLVNERDRVIGSKERAELGNDDRWRIVTIWVTDTEGNVLMAKRSADKKVQPGLWGPGASGTVTHPDDYTTSAQRELFEELGLKRENLASLGKILFKSTLGQRVCALFRTEVDLDQERISFQEEEISEVKWMSPKDLIRDYTEHPKKYVIEFGLLLEQYL
ncbi:MAG: isopentenyl-diphosphate delta-isomerase, isopentenyl-diphosphate delta-isomerase [Candidatus Saccharibacteria bacterium]|nr:isopentenyl-diphosphate delta-isomerase, isopentenyl-diphosphate delta-isomerase [Candidatus Saccharibacteria bacterium]